MPRKKTKHQFRRGTEQRYLKVALYTPRHTSNTHIPSLFIFCCALAAAIALTLSMFMSTIIQVVSSITVPQIPELPPVSIDLPDIALPEVEIPAITFPQLSFPAVSIPEITLDLSPFVIFLSGIVAAIRDFFLMLVYFCFTFFDACVTFFTAGSTLVGTFFIDAMLLPAISLLQTGLQLWGDTFFLPVSSAFNLYIESSMAFYGAVIWCVVTFINGLLAIGELLYAGGVLLVRFVTAIVVTVSNAIGSFFAAIGSGVDQTNQAIGSRIDWVIKALRPYVVYVGTIITKTLHGFQTAADTFAQTSDTMMKMYEHNAK